ncbi:hypothetical protein J6590_090541 [Homalodisca vitripennis]|nr:hypothetical protein J6590_090541 [Homalodisca vitripennis]
MLDSYRKIHYVKETTVTVRDPITAEPSQEEKNRAIISDGLNLLLYMGILAVFIGIAMYLDHKKRTRVYAIDDPQDPSNKGIPWHLYDPNFRFDPNERNAILRYSMRPRTWYVEPTTNAPKSEKKTTHFVTIPEEEETEQESVKC